MDTTAAQPERHRRPFGDKLREPGVVLCQQIRDVHRRYHRQLPGVDQVAVVFGKGFDEERVDGPKLVSEAFGAAMCA